MYVTLIPMHGRDYRSARAVRDDWEAGKDFEISCNRHRYDGKPINKSQADETGDKYSIRYAKLRKSCNV